MKGFPRHTVSPGAELYRIHRVGLDPWFFRNDGLFRFDLTGNPRHGTCYFAEEPLAAFVETLQGFRTVPIPRAELSERRLFRIRFEHALSLADVTDNAAASFEIDASISAGSEDDYARSQQFANHAYEAGFAGIRFRVRHDLTQQGIGIALFGPAGPARSLPGMPIGSSRQIPESVVGQACKSFGFMVRGPLLETA